MLILAFTSTGAVEVSVLQYESMKECTYNIPVATNAIGNMKKFKYSVVTCVEPIEITEV